MTPRELAVRCSPLIAAIGSASYFTPETLAVGKEHGLGGYRFYFLGRGGVLGDVEPQVVASAFGYFNPELVDKMWTSSREKMPPRDAARLYLECNAELGRSKLGELGLDGFCAAAGAVNDAIDPAGLALYAGIEAEPQPQDAPGLTMHLVACLREARGSAHLAAMITHGLDPRVAHYIRRPDAWEMFGWTDPPDVAARDHELLARVDESTDDMMQRPFSALDPSGADALLSGLGEIHAALGLTS